MLREAHIDPSLVQIPPASFDYISHYGRRWVLAVKEEKTNRGMMVTHKTVCDYIILRLSWLGSQTKMDGERESCIARVFLLFIMII